MGAILEQSPTERPALKWGHLAFGILNGSWSVGKSRIHSTNKMAALPSEPLKAGILSRPPPAAPRAPKVSLGRSMSLMSMSLSRSMSSKEVPPAAAPPAKQPCWCVLTAFEFTVGTSSEPSAPAAQRVPTAALRLRVEVPTAAAPSDECSLFVELGGGSGAELELLAESRDERDAWLNPIANAAVAARGPTAPPYVRHRIVLGTVFAAALCGDYPALKGIVRATAGGAACEADPDGCTAAHCAAFGGHAQALDLLLEAGAKVDAADDARLDTVLHAACRGGDADCARLSLVAGADPEALNARGCTALDLALSERRDDPSADAAALVAALCQGRCDASDALRHLVRPGPARGANGRCLPTLVVEALLRNGAKPNLAVAALEDDSGGSGGGATGPAEVLLSLWLSGADGAAEPPEEEVACLVALVTKGARVAPKALAEALPSGVGWADRVRAKVSTAGGAWAADQGLARHGTVMKHRKGWVPDKDSPTCTHCPSKFTPFFRRHHCRFCADLVCDNCSLKRLGIEGEPGKPQRACDRCFSREAVVDLPPPKPRHPFVRSPLGGGGGSSSQPEEDGGASDGGAATMAGAMSQATKTVLANTEKLKELDGKAAAVADGATEYGSLSKQLLEQSKKKSNQSSFW